MTRFLYTAALVATASASIYISYEAKNPWPAAMLALSILLIYNLPKIFENVRIFKLGKEGVELEVITKQAHSVTKEAEATISTLRELAIVLAEKISEVAAKTGRWSSGYNAKELYDLKINLDGLLSRLNIEKQDINTKEIDRIIILDLFYMITNNFIDNKIVYNELNKYIDRKKQIHFFVDIDKVEKYLHDNECFDEHIKEIINEIRHFQKNDSFISEDFLERILSEKTPSSSH